MEGDELRERAMESLVRQRRFSVLFTAYVAAALVLVAIWGLTGDGSFWPAWPIAAGAIAILGLALARSWSDRSFSEIAIRTRASHLAGRPPKGVER